MDITASVTAGTCHATMNKGWISCWSHQVKLSGNYGSNVNIIVPTVFV